jgi:hypothetical protein
MTAPIFRLLVQTVVSLGLLASGVYILVTIDLAANKELGFMAAGWIGLVAGYWLR